MKSVEKKHRRFLAAILTLCLLLGLCPLTPSAQAEETTTTTVAGSTTIEDAQSVPVGVPVTTTLNTGKNYYAIPDVKVGQQIGVELDKRYNGVSTWVYKANGDTMIGESWVADANGTYYLSISAQTQTTVTFTITLYDNDEHEPNDTIETATPIEPDKQVDAVLFGDDIDFFAITTTKANQYIALDISGQRGAINAQLYDRMGGVQKAYGNSPDSETTEYVFCTAEAGTYYLKFFTYSSRAFFSFTASLLDNDTNEPNDTKATATELHDGESTEFTVAGSDIDYFKVVTTKPGQDIALTVSGYNYANKDERFNLYFDPAEELDTRACAAYAYVSANDTLYFHAAEAGVHYIGLAYYGRSGVTTPVSCTRELSVQILDGDQNEPNDARETATRLTLGTDETFMVGGFGDEDWFSFEAAPDAEEKKLYTLSFTGLNTDYSDMFYYDVYAPDGTAVKTGTQVNIRHVSTFSCDRQGLYKVRIYTTANNSKNYYDSDWNRTSMDYARSALRICVDEGGDDPYESNDTWQTAASVPVGNVQHVLSSTTDADWFCFTVPENNMTLHLTSAAATNVLLYRADVLMEDGIKEGNSEFANSWGRDEAKGFGDLYFKLTDAGVYYIKLTADSRYVSTDIRTTGIELLPATDEENNDTWKKATPLYEGMLRSYTLSASNDVDWFKIVVPEDGTRIQFVRTNGTTVYIYREKDFQTAGDSAASMTGLKGGGGTQTDVLNLDAGVYYVKASGGPYTNCSITYNVLSASANSTLQTAQTLEAGKWAEFCGEGKYYFSIGTRKADEVVRINHDAAGGSSREYEVKLLNAAGEEVASSYSANRTLKIPAYGKYYLCTTAYLTLDANGELRYNRLRYDIGSTDDEVLYIDYEDNSIVMVEGESLFLDLRCLAYDAKSRSGDYTTYSISTPSCTSYDYSTGYLTAENSGEGTLTVSLYGNSNVKKEIPVTVLAKDSLSASDVSISGAPETLPLGASADLTANYTLAGGAVLTNSQKVVTWTSSDPKVLYVSLGGKVTAVGGGTATVTASVGGVSETSAPITVAAAAETPQETVSSIKLNKYSLTLYMNEEGEQLTATVQPASFTGKIVWKSSNTDVASVSGNGLVTAVGPGTCIISATAGNRHVSATVTVLPARVRVSGVSFAESKHEIPMGGTATLTATITPADATVKTLVWTSDDSGIASVSRTGIVTAVSVGTTKIHATSVDGNHSAEVTVTVTAAPQLGDVNGDGYIDSADAMLCLRSAVGLTELTAEQKSAADVNKDGFVDAGDAIKILRYDAKLIDSLN